jgi:hypothetical protein
MPRTARNVTWMVTVATIATMIPTTLLAVPPHTSEGQCADFVVAQYNKDGDKDGLDFGLQDCEDAYAEDAAAAIPINQLQLQKGRLGGGFIILAVPPPSLSSPSTESAEPRR